MLSDKIKAAVRRRMKTDDKSLRRVAAVIVIDPSQLSRWLNGKASVSVEVLDELAKWARVKVVAK